MYLHYPPNMERPTPAYILEVMIDAYRQQLQFDPETEPDIVLTMNTTVAEWRVACDLGGWKRIGKSLNAAFRIDCSEKEWKQVLTPPKMTTLQDVCELVARYAERPRIRPARLFGATCQTAGAFLTVRSLLHEAGAEVRALRPSSALAPYTRKHPDVFLGSISELAPGKLPLVDIENLLLRRVGQLLILNWLVVGVSWTLGYTVLAERASLVAGLVLFCLCLAAQREPSRVDFGELKTFRDLVEVLV
ncbi:MAG: hypothetical protein HOP18_11950 [Deltaproteobacteria bacterium]|nr:hypothetical protein [Deltaproteobacteria bacterium]